MHASGKAVWAAFFPGVSVGDDAVAVQAHDMVVVRSVTNVPQTARHHLPGATAVDVAVVGLVIDAVTGRIVERMSAPASSAAQADDLSVLGTPTVVVLTDVTPPAEG